MADRSGIGGLNPETKRIFKLILFNGALTKGQLSMLSELKLTTLNRMMLPLEKLGFIVEGEIGESSGGRKPVLYDVNPRKYYIVGVDISRTYTQLVLTNLKMEPVESFRFEMSKESSPEATLKLIQDWVVPIVEKLEAAGGLVIGIGIGTVGPLDRNNGILLNPADFEAEGWENVPLKSILEERLGLPVVVDNGANAAVYAETYFGTGKGISNVVYLNCGIGIRTGVISSGVFVRTINDAEDAFAHMIVDVDGKECSCGNYGCIERYSSIHAVLREFRSEMKKGKSCTIQKPVQEITYIDICKAAEAGDAIARHVLQHGAVIMGTGLANFIKLINPGLVMLSGPLIRHSEFFYRECVETACKKGNLNKEKSVVFSRGGYFDENVIAIGSAALVLENHLTGIF